MAYNFDFETALDLLPVMRREDTTIELITNIDFYNSLLNEKSKPILIKFVLKTRLTTIAKFNLKENYSNVQDLLSDMVHYLLPKKIQIELENSLNFNKQANNESNIDHSYTIIANQNKVSSSECISQDQQSSHCDLSECIDLNIFNNSVMKSDPSPVCDDSQVDIYTSVNVCYVNKVDVVTDDKIKHFKNNILSLKQPQAENDNKSEKGIVKNRSKDAELSFGNNTGCIIKSRRIFKSNEGFCFYTPLENKLYLDLTFLEIGKNFIKDLEVFCRNKNIKVLKMNKNRSNRKDIKKFIRVIRKYNVGYPRIKINNDFIDIMKVKEVTSKYTRNDDVKNKNNDIKMSTKVETMNNKKKKVKLLKSTDDKIKHFKNNILSLKQPQAENDNKSEKGIVKNRSKDAELSFGNNTGCIIKSRRIFKSNEGFCFYTPLENKLYLDLTFLEIGKNFIKDLEVFCRNKNIKVLKMNKNRSNRKDIKKFIRVIRKYNVGYPRIKINNDFIDIMKVKEVTSKYTRNDDVKNKNNDIKMSTKVETMNNKKKKVKLLKSNDKWSSDILDNVNDKNNENIIIYKIESERSNKVYCINEEYKEKYFVTLCEMYDKRSVGIT
ncbi:hypothetical protein O3G_MSEX013713 [Manduca sexta]|uniref:Uncharacterized protein n=1 Tax=Manduca sexta TaxID=7130 RepID=A0A921ZRT5_MANSE|nr:hypothetical protein O3G_MSEX013713 [Manduca sexta]